MTEPLAPIRTLPDLVAAIQEHIDSTGKHVYAEDLQATLDRVDDATVDEATLVQDASGTYTSAAVAELQHDFDAWKARSRLTVPAVPVAALRALQRYYQPHPSSDLMSNPANPTDQDWVKWDDLAALCDAQERT